MKSKMKKLLAFVCILVLSISAVAINTPTEEVKAAEETEVTPVYLEGFKHVTLNSFYNKNYNGTSTPLQMQEGTYTGSKDLKYFITYDGKTESSFHNTLLSFKMKCETAGQTKTRLRILTNDSWSNGLQIQKSNDGTTLQFINNIGTSDTYIGSDNAYSFSAQNIGITNFSEAFILQFSIEYGDFPDANIVTPDETVGNDIKIGVYFNGRLYDFNGDGVSDAEDKITIRNCDSAKMGNCLTLTVSTDYSIDLYSVVPEKPDWTPITWSDFAEDKAYVHSSTDQVLDSSKYPNVSKLGSTSFEANIRFTGQGVNRRINYGGTGIWTGVSLYVNGSDLMLRSIADLAPTMYYISTDTALSSITFAPTTALGAETTTFLNTEFTLKITTQYGDYDKDGYADDVEFGIFFNGDLYDNRYIYLKDYVATDATPSSYLGNHIGVCASTADTAATMIRSTPKGKEVSHQLSTLADGKYVDLATDFAEDSVVYSGETIVDTTSGLSKSGDYKVKDASDNVLGQVILYESGDTHPDGESDVRDLVAMKKVNQGTALSTWSGTMGHMRLTLTIQLLLIHF